MTLSATATRPSFGLSAQISQLVRAGTYSMEYLRAAYEDPEATSVSDRPGCQDLTWFMRGNLAVLVVTGSGVAISVAKIFSVHTERILCDSGIVISEILHSALVSRGIAPQEVQATLTEPDSCRRDAQGQLWHLRKDLCLAPDAAGARVLSFAVRRTHAVMLQEPVQVGPCQVTGYDPAVVYPRALSKEQLHRMIAEADTACAQGHRFELGISSRPGHTMVVDPWGVVIWAGKEKVRDV